MPSIWPPMGSLPKEALWLASYFQDGTRNNKGCTVQQQHSLKRQLLSRGRWCFGGCAVPLTATSQVHLYKGRRHMTSLLFRVDELARGLCVPREWRTQRSKAGRESLSYHYQFCPSSLQSERAQTRSFWVSNCLVTKLHLILQICTVCLL